MIYHLGVARPYSLSFSTSVNAVACRSPSVRLLGLLLELLDFIDVISLSE